MKVFRRNSAPGDTRKDISFRPGPARIPPRLHSTRFRDRSLRAAIPSARRTTELDLLPIAGGAARDRDQVAAHRARFHGKILFSNGKAVFNVVRHFWPSAPASGASRDATHFFPTNNGFSTHLFGYAEFQPDQP